MEISEKELEDLIWSKIKASEFSDLQAKGLPMNNNNKYFRQFNFGSYGVADIVGVCAVKLSNSWRLYLSIFELKKDRIGSKTLSQAARYVKAAQRMACQWNEKYAKNRIIELDISIHLIGDSVETGGFVYLADIFDKINIYTYSIDFDDGLCFDKKYDYRLIEEKPFNFPSLKGCVHEL